MINGRHAWRPAVRTSAEKSHDMLEAVVFTYGMLASFVLSGATRNAKARRANPRMLQYVGYVLMSFSAALGILLLGYAAMMSLSG